MALVDPRPQGSIEELQAAGLPLTDYGSCAKQVKGEVLGCGRHADCPWRDGPKYVGVEKLMNEPGRGTAERTMVLTCWEYLTQKPPDNDENELWTILGFEGTEFKTAGTEKMPLEVGQTTPVHKDVHFDVKVLPYPRLTERYKMVGRMQELREKRILENREKRKDAFLRVGEDQPLTEDKDARSAPERSRPVRRNG